MNTPTKYAWLSRIGLLPRTISEGLKLLGTAEVVGKGSNRTIIGWRDELNGATTNGKPIITGFTDDDIPWCGLYVAIVVFRRMRDILEVIKAPLWARNWAAYGVSVAFRRNGKLVNVNGMAPSLGDVLVFERGKGGHVGFYVAEDATHFHVLGGNQSNRVSIARLEKTRCLNVRRPPYKTQARSVKPYIVAASGAVSTNEA
jgi:uncharacterized protein (TIGR02594 family)